MGMGYLRWWIVEPNVKSNSRTGYEEAVELLCTAKYRQGKSLRALSFEEKMESSQQITKNCYELFSIISVSGGPDIPDRYRRWRKAQEAIIK